MRNFAQTCLFILSISLFLLTAQLFPAAYSFGQEPSPSPPPQPPPLAPLSSDPLQRGQQLLTQGDLDGAAQAFEEVLKKSPKHPEANYYLGLILMRKNEMEAAIQRFQNVLAAVSEHLPSLYNMGLAQNALGRSEEAIASFKKVTQLDPRNYAAYFQLGDLYERQENVEDAIRSFQAVVELAKPIPEAQQLVSQAQARLVQLGGDPIVARQVLDLFKKGQAAIKEGNLDEADTALSEILNRLVPQHVSARFLLAQVHLRRGQVVEATKKLEAAVKIDLQAWRIYIFLAQVYAEQGFFEEAIVAYTAAATILRQGPIYEEIRKEVATLREVVAEHERLEQFRKELPTREANNLFNQGIALLREGNTDKAIEQIKLAIDKNPNNPFFHYNLGIAYFNQETFLLATRSLLKAIELNDKFGPAHFFLGLVYNASGDAGRNQGDIAGASQEYGKSAEELNKALELGIEQWAKDEVNLRLPRLEKAMAISQESIGHTILATALSEQKEYDRALREFRVAAELIPQDPISRISIGQVYEILKRDEEAIAAYQEAIAASPRSSDPHIQLGLYFQRNKQLEKAKEAFLEANKLNPRLPEPFIRLGRLHFEQNEDKEAQDYFEKAIKLDPRQAEPHFYLGQIFERNNEYDRAVIEYGQDVELLPVGSESSNFALQRLGVLRRFTGNWNHTFIAYDNNANNSDNNPQGAFSSTFNLDLSYKIFRLPRIHRLLPIPLTIPVEFQSSTTSLVYTENLFNNESLSLSLQSNFLEKYSLSTTYRLTYNYNDINGPFNFIHTASLVGSRDGEIPSQISLIGDFTSIASLVSPRDDRVSYGMTIYVSQTRSLGSYGNAVLSYTFSNRDYTNIIRVTRSHAVEIAYSKPPYGSVSFDYVFTTNEDLTIRLEESGKDNRFSLGYSNTLFRKLGFTTGLDYTLSNFDIPRRFVRGQQAISTTETNNTVVFRLSTTYPLANGLNLSMNYSFVSNLSNLNIPRAQDITDSFIRQQLDERARFLSDYRKHLISFTASKSF